MRLNENRPVARENVIRDAVAARSGQAGLVVEIGDGVAPDLEAAAGAAPADVRSV